MLLFVSIVSFIFSNIIALALLFTGKKLNPGWFRMLASLHIIFGVMFLFNFLVNKEESPRYISFLVFFCSGIITGGLALGTPANLLLKMYFGIYCLSVFAFIISPSWLLNFLLTASPTKQHESIPVKANYFLEQQSSVFSSGNDEVKYKLIEKKGMFHKTITRDIFFNGKLDSIRVLSFEELDSAMVRGFTSRKSIVEDEIDSVDVTIDLDQASRNEIRRKL